MIMEATTPASGKLHTIMIGCPPRPGARAVVPGVTNHSEGQAEG